MYQPKFSITNSLLNNIVKFEVEKSQVESQVIPTSTNVKLTKKAKALNILHFAHLIGIKITLKDAAKVAEGKKLVTDDARGIILNNFRNVLEYTRSNVSDSYVDIDVSILIHLNKILLTDWRETWEAKFRTGGEDMDLNLENWTSIRDESIDSSQIQKEVIDLLDWYKSSYSKVHNLIRIAAFIHRLMEISPFIFANKLTTIALSDFLLHKNGYVQKTFLPTVRNFDVYEDEYLETWQRIEGQELDLTKWTERYIRNLSHDMATIKDEIKKISDEEDSKIKKPFLDLNKRQLKILRYLQTIPTLRREDYVQMMDVSTMTAYRDLNDLVDKKLLKVDGQGRGTKYMLYSR